MLYEVASPLEHPFRNSMLSLTQAHLSCGCPPSFAPVQPVPCHSVFHPWDLMTPISCVCSYTSWFRHYKSSTFPPTQKTFSITYGSGNMKGFLAYHTVRVTCKEKLSQDWLWSNPCLQNGCRTIRQDSSYPNSHRHCPSYPQDPVPGEAVPMVTHEQMDELTQRVA